MLTRRGTTLASGRAKARARTITITLTRAGRAALHGRRSLQRDADGRRREDGTARKTLSVR